MASYEPATVHAEQLHAEHSDKVLVSETVELALVIVALTPLGLEDEAYSPINRTGEYYGEVEDRFGAFRNHPAVKALGTDFSMPRFVGNAADFELVSGNKLKQTSFEGSLWADANGDLFRKNIGLIEDFAKASNFREFFQKRSDYYTELEFTADTINDVAHMTSWLERNFSSRPNRATVFISMLLDGHHWTSGNEQASLKIWVNAPRIGYEKELGEVNRLNKVRAIFTELDHPYVNPISAAKSATINDALSRKSFWATGAAWENYGSAELVFNEYMTYGVFLLYAREALPNEDEFQALKRSVDNRMTNRRGFIKFSDFSTQLLSLSASPTYVGKAESLFDPMIDWCNDQSKPT